MGRHEGGTVRRRVIVLSALVAGVSLTAGAWGPTRALDSGLEPRQATSRTFAEDDTLPRRPDSPHERVLYSFLPAADGSAPSGGLFLDANGALYGTTQYGGTLGNGTVFKLTPSGHSYTESVIYKFQGGSDGSLPEGGIVADANGNLYGTTYRGGGSSLCNNFGCGTVFKLTRAGSSYTETVLHSFQGSDGGPVAGLFIDKTGALYGTTSGAFGGYGTVFKLTPSGSGYAETIPYAFRGGPDGSNPSGRVFVDAAGAVYGTTALGGLNSAGTAFKLTPFRTFYTESILYSFGSTSVDGRYPYCQLIRDSTGALYGTTSQGGLGNSGGTVFKLTRSGSHYTETVLHNFGTYPDGANPYFGLSIGRTDALYGVTVAGGTGGWGTVFKLVPSGSGYSESVLYSFRNGNSDGASPSSGLLRGPTGAFYGSTSQGGVGPNFNNGTVYRLNP